MNPFKNVLKSSENQKLKVGVVGATGLVGTAFLDLIKERGLPYGELRLFASKSSAGKIIDCGSDQISVEELSESRLAGLDLVFFSSGNSISKEWAPKAVQAGAIAVDNSSAFRMNPDYPLVVPEVNGNLLDDLEKPTIIANPNCSTIQLVLALAPLQKSFGLSSVKVATYQAVSGAGTPAIATLKSECQKSDLSAPSENSPFPKPIGFNCIPEIGDIDDQGFFTEESKLMNETCKILQQPSLSVSAFAVRVPVENGHSEAAWVTLESEVTRPEIIKALQSAPGIETLDSMANYRTPIEISGKDNVSVGRIHQDSHDSRTWMMWVVGDNLLKGAALNGIQIAERIFDIKPRS